jgi:hypothetical protein
MERNVIKRPLVQQYRNARYDSAVQCDPTCAQEMEQIAQHAGRGAPDVKALVRHGVEAAPSAGNSTDRRWWLTPSMRKASGTSKISATSAGSARSLNGGCTRPTTGVTR